MFKLQIVFIIYQLYDYKYAYPLINYFDYYY